MLPRVWFGTMYSGEAELALCQAHVSTQNGLQEILQHVVMELPEKEAHNSLWAEWARVKDQFDLFVKVDADTIIEDPGTVARVWMLFEGNPRVTGVQLRLHDYFTDSLISGLNFFSTKVEFNTSPDLYCDRVDSNHDIVLKGEAVKHLEPGGKHCAFPNDAQAFHFGLHRMLKGQRDTLEKVYHAYEKYQDRARGLALIGAHEAIVEAEGFLKENSYTSKKVKNWISIVEDMNDNHVKTIVESFVNKMGWK